MRKIDFFFVVILTQAIMLVAFAANPAGLMEGGEGRIAPFYVGQSRSLGFEGGLPRGWSRRHGAGQSGCIDAPPRSEMWYNVRHGEDSDRLLVQSMQTFE